jgi:hypothetical protein
MIRKGTINIAATNCRSSHRAAAFSRKISHVATLDSGGPRKHTEEPINGFHLLIVHNRMMKHDTYRRIYSKE